MEIELLKDNKTSQSVLPPRDDSDYEEQQTATLPKNFPHEFEHVLMDIEHALNHTLDSLLRLHRSDKKPANDFEAIASAMLLFAVAAAMLFFKLFQALYHHFAPKQADARQIPHPPTNNQPAFASPADTSKEREVPQPLATAVHAPVSSARVAKLTQAHAGELTRAQESLPQKAAGNDQVATVSVGRP